MPETFLALLTAHLLSDFPFQTDTLIARKAELKFLLLHIAIVANLSVLLLGCQTPTAAVAVGLIFLTHFAMDYAKIHWIGDSLWSFLFDQFVHIAVIAGIAVALPDLAAAGWWGRLPGDFQAAYYTGCTLLCAVIAAIHLGGIMIAKIVKPLTPPQPPTAQAEEGEDIQGMAMAGRYIGWLERGLTLMLVLIQQPQGVGFLLAAKSILRFGNITNNRERRQAEYIIIGTFLSFGWGLIVALATRSVLPRWGLF